MSRTSNFTGYSQVSEAVDRFPAASASVTCVVLNWNGWRDTVACLRTLASQDWPSLRVLVVDNSSADDSVERLLDAFPSGAGRFQVEVLVSPENRGFAAGCNLGIRAALHAGADFVWLLNNDTLAPPATLSLLLAEASRPHDERGGASLGNQVKSRYGLPGLVGTVLRYMHEPARTQAWGGGTVKRWLGYTTHFHGPAPLAPNSFLTFASVLIRREVFVDIGLLDERYFMYFEDADFCFRARAAGWKLAVAAQTSVLHKEGASAAHRDASRFEPPWKQRVVTASGLRFLDLHGRPAALAVSLFLTLRLMKRLFRGDFAGLRAVAAGVSDWYREPPPAFVARSSEDGA